MKHKYNTGAEDDRPCFCCCGCNQSKNVEALGCLAVLYMRHTNFASVEDTTVEAAAAKAAKEGQILLQVRACWRCQ